MKNINNSQSIRPETNKYSWYFKIGCVIGVGFLQTSLFYLTYQLYHIIEYPFYVDLETWLDGAVPYIEWSWTFYYFGFFYIICWGAAGIWRMTNEMIRRTIRIYVLLVLSGAALHLIIPSDSPWPLISTLSETQHSFKSAFSIEPLAGFPSMHAAMAILPAIISLHTFKSAGMKILSLVLSILVCISVVTAKEHWAIDVPVGMLLGLVAARGWYYYAWRNHKSREQSLHNSNFQELDVG